MRRATKPSAFWPSLLTVILSAGRTLARSQSLQLHLPQLRQALAAWVGHPLDHERILVPDGIHRVSPPATSPSRRRPKRLSGRAVISRARH